MFLNTENSRTRCIPFMEYHRNLKGQLKPNYLPCSPVIIKKNALRFFNRIHRKNTYVKQTMMPKKKKQNRVFWPRLVVVDSILNRNVSKKSKLEPIFNSLFIKCFKKSNYGSQKMNQPYFPKYNFHYYF